MSNTEVGVLIDPTQPRDAIHIAVAPVCASMQVSPGNAIAFVDGSTTEIKMAPWPVSVGIVDPFLRKPVEKGQWFWMWVHPNTITSLRHNWTHPAFNDDAGPDLAAKAKSEEWLREFCANHDCPYDGMIAATSGDGEWVDGDNYHSVHISGDYFSVQGQDASGEIPDEFWKHVETVTGKKQTNRPEHFSCSC